MTRELLIRLWPLIVALFVGCGLVVLLVKLSGAKLELSRLRNLNRCQHGGVQSLAFVLTFPIFLMVVMFVVQVSQLMIAVMVVNSAAFSSARALTVWAAEDFSQVDSRLSPNKFDQAFVIIPQGDDLTRREKVLLGYQSELQTNPKMERTYRAAALALAPICPSRDLGYELPQIASSIPQMAYRLQTTVAPSMATNDRLQARIQNKLAYAYNHTAVRIDFADKDTLRGPTYNPRTLVELQDGLWVEVWDPHEVGWQDPFRVTVTHHLGLLPGPGRFLAARLVRADGRPDTVSPRVTAHNAPGGELYTVPVVASCTMTNEGLESVAPIQREGF